MTYIYTSHMINSHAVYRIQKNRNFFFNYSTIFASKELKAYNQFIKLMVKKNRKIKTWTRASSQVRMSEHVTISDISFASNFITHGRIKYKFSCFAPQKKVNLSFSYYRGLMLAYMFSTYVFSMQSCGPWQC